MGLDWPLGSVVSSRSVPTDPGYNLPCPPRQGTQKALEMVMCAQEERQREAGQVDRVYTGKGQWGRVQGAQSGSRAGAQVTTFR